MESTVNFPWLSTMSPSRLYEILIFFAYYCRGGRVRWHNGGLPRARLNDDLNTDGRCITVWNLSAVGVTGPTSRYSCITCLRVVVSGILSGELRIHTCVSVSVRVYIYTRMCICLHTYAHVATEFETRWINAARMQRERSRTVEIVYSRTSINAASIRKLFICKTIYK